MLKSEISRANAICKKLSSKLERLRLKDVSGWHSRGYVFAIVRERGEEIQFPDGSGSFISWTEVGIIERTSREFSPDLESRCAAAVMAAGTT